MNCPLRFTILVSRVATTAIRSLLPSQLLYMSEKFYCMVMRMNIDCDGCYRRISKALLKMHDLESHMIERKQCRVSVCGVFEPQALAIRMRKATNRRVEILETREVSKDPGRIEDTDGGDGGEGGEKKKKKNKKKKVQFDS